MSIYWERFKNWINYSIDHEVFLVLLVSTKYGTELNKSEAKNVLWSFLNYLISFEEAYILLQRVNIPDQWKSKLWLYED
jgi:hypothetical protein